MAESDPRPASASDGRPVLDLTESQRAALARLARDEYVIPPPIALARDAVIPSDPIKGERIKAFVVLKPAAQAGAGLVASLKDHVRQDLGPIAQPSEIDLVPSLPRTRSGKVMRRLLMARELGEDPGDLSTMAD